MNALCVALIEIKLTCDERREMINLESHQVPQARSYKVEIMVGARGAQMISMVTHHTGTSPILIKEKLIMAKWTSSIQMGETSHLLSASSNPIEARASISLHLQIGPIHEKVEFLEVLGLAKNMPLDTASIIWYTKNIWLKTETIRFVNTSLVATVKMPEESLAMDVDKGKHREPYKASYAIARTVRLSPMSETFVWFRPSAGTTRLGETHDDLAGRYRALVAQGVVDKALRIPFVIELTNQSSLNTQLSESTKITKYSPGPLMCFKHTEEEDESDNVIAVQIHKAFKSKQEMMSEHYDMMQQDATFPEKHWTDTTHFRKQFTDFNYSFLEMIE